MSIMGFAAAGAGITIFLLIYALARTVRHRAGLFAAAGDPSRRVDELVARLQAKVAWFTGGSPEAAGSRNTETAMEVALMAISSALKAGRSLPQALEYAATHTAGPVGKELGAVALQARTGDWEGAFAAWYERRPTADVKALKAAVQIHRITGGELSFLLGRLAAALRDQLLYKSEARSRTIEARGSAVILAVAPLLLLVYMGVMQGESLHYLISEPIGLLALGYGLASWVVGLLIIVRQLQAAEPGPPVRAAGRPRRGRQERVSHD